MKISIRYSTLIMLPPIIWALFFIILPLLAVLYLSFKEMPYDALPHIILFSYDSYFAEPYLGNYIKLFTDPIYVNIFIQAINLSFFSTLITLFIAYPMAFTISQQNDKVKNILILLVILPFWTAFLIRVYAWMVILKNNGLLNQMLMALGFVNEPIHILNTKIAATIGIVYCYLPFMILPIYSSLEKINPHLYEAAQDLGSTPIKTIFNVALPLSVPGIIAGCLLVFIPAMGEFVIPDLLGGPQVINIGKVIWNEFFLNRDWCMASALTMVITALIVAPIIFIQKLLDK